MAIALFMAFSLSSCNQEPKLVDIVATAKATPQLSTLVTAIEAAGLASTLSTDTLTVFAPSNAAFEALPAGTLEDLLKPENKETLVGILTYHVVVGKLMSTYLEAGAVATLQGKEVTIDLSNGVKVNEATVITPDCQATNGVVHIIDQVLIPPAPVLKSIVEVAKETESLSVLVEYLVQARLVETLEGEGPFTVFCPTNEAFEALPKQRQQQLKLNRFRDELVSILTYHVVPGEIMSTDLSDGQSAPTAQGGNLTVSLTDGVKINDATVVSADIKCSNGVVHIIDKVMVPAAE